MFDQISASQSILMTFIGRTIQCEVPKTHFEVGTENCELHLWAEGHEDGYVSIGLAEDYTLGLTDCEGDHMEHLHKKLAEFCADWNALVESGSGAGVLFDLIKNCT